MKPQYSITNISLEMFKTIIQGKRVVLLYPRIAYRNVFLAYFLQYAPAGFLYYRIPDAALRLSDWLQNLVMELQTLVSGFGKHLAAALPEASPNQLGTALAADLAAVPANTVILCLDELDRVPQDGNFQAFMRSLVAALPEHAQLVINARLLTYYPWIEMIHQQQAAVLGTTFRRNNLIFTLDGTLQPQLEVYAFGQGYVLVDGYPVENWDGALPRNLFFYFIDNPLVTRDQIFKTFWARLSKKEATNVFHVTKRKITERMGEHMPNAKDAELTKFAAGFYMPSGRITRHYDVADFEEALEQAPIAESEAEQEHLFRRAIAIYRAPFLTTVDMPWVIERRQRLQAMMVDALIGIGRLKMRQAQYAPALGFFTRALKEAPGREDIYRYVMTMYWKMGRTEDAVEHYRMLELHLAQAVGVPPSRETRELFEQIRREHEQKGA